MKKKIIVSTVGAFAAVILTATSAVADTGTVVDPTGDAVAITEVSSAYGSWDIDLTSATIDSHDDVLSITGTFSGTTASSWNNFEVFLDVNADTIPDFVLLWSKQYGFSGAYTTDATKAFGSMLCPIATGEVVGVPGAVTVSVSRACIGSPASVQAHVDAFWFGYNTYGYDLSFVDSAPGSIADPVMQFSAPVNNSSTLVVPSAVAPVVTAVVPVAAPTKVVLDFAAHSVHIKKKTTKVVAHVKTTGNPKGRVRFYDGKKVIHTVAVHGGKSVLLLSKKLKVGKHKISATFFPDDSTKFARSTSKVTVFRVKK